MVDELDNMTWWVQQIRDGSYSTAPLDSRHLIRDYTDVVTQLRNEVLHVAVDLHFLLCNSQNGSKDTFFASQLPEINKTSGYK